MSGEVVDRELRRFVVRLEDPVSHVVWGSGVFVGQGTVLTCAHVVQDASTVIVVPDRRAAAEGHAAAPADVRGVVRARSELRDAGSTSSFWPYPDLAIVELGWQDHVCAPTEVEEPTRHSEPHAWGYGRLEDHVAAEGGPASFSYVGHTNDGYFELKASEAPPGLSGAPLVCPTRRSVVGLMSVSRSVTSPRGGWASPMLSLCEPDVGGELAQFGPRLEQDNREAAWRHRDAWARVVVVPGAQDMVDRPWVGATVNLSAGQGYWGLRRSDARHIGA